MRLHWIVFIYGFTGILGQLIHVDALELVWHRMWMASVVIFLYLLIKKRTDFHLNRSSWNILLAGIIIAAHWVTFFHAIKISNVSVALSCISTGAFFGSLLEPLFNKRKPDLREILLGLIVILGLYLIFKFEGDYWAGIITALISAFLSACFTIINSRLVKRSTPYRITFLEMLGGWIALSLFMFFYGSLSSEVFNLIPMDWLYLAILGSICTAYAFIENVALMRQISPFSFLLAINLEPVYGILLALLIFGQKEQMNLYFYIGAALILSTVFFDIYIKRKLRKKNRLIPPSS